MAVTCWDFVIQWRLLIYSSITERQRQRDRHAYIHACIGSFTIASRLTWGQWIRVNCKTVRNNKQQCFDTILSGEGTKTGNTGLCGELIQTGEKNASMDGCTPVHITLGAYMSYSQTHNKHAHTNFLFHYNLNNRHTEINLYFHMLFFPPSPFCINTIGSKDRRS